MICLSFLDNDLTKFKMISVFLIIYQGVDIYNYIKYFHDCPDRNNLIIKDFRNNLKICKTKSFN